MEHSRPINYFKRFTIREKEIEEQLENEETLREVCYANPAVCLVCNQFWNLSVFVDEEEEKETNNKDIIKKKKSQKRQASRWDEGWRDRNWREPLSEATGMPSYKETVVLQSHRGHLVFYILLGHHKL